MKQDTCDGVTEEPLGSVIRRTPHKTEQFIQYRNKQQESCLLLAELMCKELHGMDTKAAVWRPEEL